MRRAAARQHALACHFKKIYKNSIDYGIILSSEQNERLTAYWANRCVRERMPVESIGRLEQEHRKDGRHLLHTINQNGNQIVIANLEQLHWAII